MDLSEMFYRIPHNFLMAKIHAYSLSTEVSSFACSCLQRQAFLPKQVHLHARTCSVKTA